MSKENWDRLRALFAEAQGLSIEDRAAFLDRVLPGEPGLRAQVEALLANADSAGSFLIGRDEEAEAPQGVSPTPGSVIGAYRLLEFLGEGGFGVVYLAEQERPIRRRVALKLIKPGMDTKQVIARFEAERQTLALMDHAGIAQVFDAGETDAGRPYFAMEYVPGTSITTFCDQERLRIRERLEIFLQVCDAVQHAHQKGVVHRDIKPSNVLVARRDGGVTLKVIDFGIVKATGAAADDRSFATREGMVLGTLGYMSPEQAGATGAVVDTRSDIYSLGVLLYELLAGEMPFDKTRLRQAAWTDAVRIIREEDPPSLTARIARIRQAETAGSERPPAEGEKSAGQDRVAEIARHRSVDERTLVRELRGELEWITLRALEKAPEHRYASASELAADVRRHLANETVLARAPRTVYRVRKFARRHRVGVAAAALVLLSIVTGAVAAGIGFTRAVRAERIARREADSARRVADFLVELFQTSDPSRSRGEKITARTLLDQGTRRIRASSDQDPHIRARLLATLGKAHQSLGLYDEGLSLLREALLTSESAQPSDRMEVAEQLRGLAAGLRRVPSKTEDVDSLIDHAMAIAQETNGSPKSFLAACLCQKAEWAMGQGNLAGADSLITIALHVGESDARPDTFALARIYMTRARIAHWRYALKDAERDFLRALDLSERVGSDPSRSASLHSQLAAVYSGLHESEKALSHAEESVRISRQLYPPDHPGIALALTSLAASLTSQGDFEQAAQVRVETIRILRANGERDDMLAEALNNQGIVYRALGKYDLAIQNAEEASTLTSKLYGLESTRTAEVLANLARYYADDGQSARADSTYQIAIPIFERLGKETIYAAYALMGYANACRAAGRLPQAETLYMRAEAIMDTSEAGFRPFVVECLSDHAYLLSIEGRHAEAESLMRSWFAIAERDGEAYTFERIPMHVQWAAARARAGDADGAIDELENAVRSGAKPGEVDAFPELLALRSRDDYPGGLRAAAARPAAARP